MDSLDFNSLLCWLSSINPLYAMMAFGVWYVFGDRIKSVAAGLLGRLKSLVPSGAASDPVDTWLESHPLLDRVWLNVKDQFLKAVKDGKMDEDSAYIALLDSLKKAFAPKQ